MLPQREQQQQRQQQQPRRLTVQERLSQRRQELLVRRQLRGTPDQAPAAAGLKDVAAADAACGWGAADAAVPARDHPLAAAVQNSSRLLAAKLQV
jgi:hypothetical protein